MPVSSKAESVLITLNKPIEGWWGRTLFVFGELLQEDRRFSALLDLDFAGELQLVDHHIEALIILFETQLVPRFSGASPARAANLVALVRGGGARWWRAAGQATIICRALPREREVQRTSKTNASATGGGTHRGGRVCAIVVEVQRIACHFVQRHGADGAEKSQTRSGQEGLAHGLLAQRDLTLSE